MTDFKFTNSRLPWLEIGLAMAVIVLLWQMFPSVFIWGLSLLDFRAWQRTTWFMINLIFVLGLIAAKFGPGLYETWKFRQHEKALQKEKDEELRNRREQRELVRRIKEGRSRRMY